MKQINKTIKYAMKINKILVNYYIKNNKLKNYKNNLLNQKIKKTKLL